jgi:hypothetical protein
MFLLKGLRSQCELVVDLVKLTKRRRWLLGYYGGKGFTQALQYVRPFRLYPLAS